MSAQVKKSTSPMKSATRSGYRRSRRSGTKYRRAPTNVNVRRKSSQPLSTINLVSILNSFYTIRSTVKDLRVSLEKLDSAMDSAYQMFEMAQGFMKNEQSNVTPEHRPPLQLLPAPKSRTAQPRRTSEPAKKKTDDANAPLAGLFDNIDIGQIIGLMQSPLVQGLLKQFMSGGFSTDHSEQHAKEG